MEIAISLKNPPSRGNYWQLILFNEVWGDQVTVGKHIPVDQPITLKSVPAEWRAPVYIDIMIYELNVSPYNIVYRVQSAYGSDWPNYEDITIPDYGSYSYNVATGELESIAPELTLIEITAPDSAEEGETVSVSTRVTNTSANSKLFRVTLYAARDIFVTPAPEERIGSLEVRIGSGQFQIISGSFTMPAWDSNVLVTVHRFIDFWDFDNSATKVVSLEVVAPGVAKGTIIQKELEYDGSRKSIPVY